MNIEQMKTELGMKSVPGYFADYYKEIEETWHNRAALILSENYIKEVLTDANALLPYMEMIFSAAAEIRKNTAMCLLICILEKWVRQSGNTSDSFYIPPAGTGLAYDFLHLFVAIPTIPDSVDFLRVRNVPKDIIISTLREYDMCVEMCRVNIGRPAFDRGRLNWICRIIRNNMLWVGRLRFELPTKRLGDIKVYKNKDGELAVFADGLHIHRSGQLVGSAGCENEDGSFVAEAFETDGEIIGHIITDGNVAKEKTILSKNEWELCLSKEDNVVPVHIPRSGSFEPETVEQSYARVRKILSECFSDMPYKAFHCRSWMMSRDLRKVLKSDSNILAFQNRYIHYPTLSAGVWTLGNVFPGEGGLDNLDNFSENTSLQRNIKAYYKSGNYIYDDCGFFLKI